jgi:predicted ABC-type ATPase
MRAIFLVAITWGCLLFVGTMALAAGDTSQPTSQPAADAVPTVIMLREIAARASRGESFAFETTLSGLSYARQIPEWRHAGYHVKLAFLSLPSPELALLRVKARVAQGGHNIPEEVVRRRFDAGLRNFSDIYKGW